MSVRDERGASLVLALAFITFMGVFSVAILAFTGVGSTTTGIVDARTDQRYAADAGMEHGIANLVADDFACRLPSSTHTWPMTSVNAHDVTYACAAPSALLGEYGTVITGAGGISLSRANASKMTVQYQASLHTAGPITFGEPAEQTFRVDGNLTVAGTCPVPNVTTVGPYSCALSSLPSLPEVDVYVPTTAAAPPTVSGGCTTLYPGRYGTGGLAIPAFDRRDSYYLASGVYYVNGGPMTLQGTVFGGARDAAVTQAMTGSAPCRASDPTGTGYSGSGVTFVLGGTGSLRVQNAGSRVELFARVPGGLDAGATPGVAVWAGTGSSVIDGSGPYESTADPAPIFSTDSGALDLVVHGAVVVPAAGTQLFVHDNAEAGGSVVLPGGLLTSWLQIVVANGDDGKRMIVAGRIPPRRPVLTAIVPGRTGGSTLTMSAVIRPDGSPLVAGWRVS